MKTRKHVHKGTTTKTAKQWLKEGRVVKENATGERLWTNGYCQISAVYYAIEDTYKISAEELKRLREPELAKKREYARAKREQERAEKILWEEIQKAQNLPSIPCNNPSKIVVFDVETTGLNPYEDEILQFSACDGDGNTLLNTYIRPHVKKSWTEMERIHGISVEMVANAPYFHEVLPVIKGIFESAEVLVAYNGDFDMRFLDESGITIDLKGKEYDDVMLMFAPVYNDWDEKHQNYKWQKLTTCAAHYGYEFSAHNALEDVRATLHCWKCIQKDMATQE